MAGMNSVLYFGILCGIILPYIIDCRSTYSSSYSAKVFSKNVTHLLDSLLSKYDKRIRPGHGGKPTTIRVNMNVRSMGPFSELKQTGPSVFNALLLVLENSKTPYSQSYSMQLYLRQEWQDSRLTFNFTDFGRSEFSMNWMFAAKLWKPDTFFINGKNSYLHRITSPNMFIRLNSNGLVTWSMRLTVRATCEMHLRKYPLDTQVCPLTLASYGYTSRDVQYHWDISKNVTVNEDVSMAQYELVSINTSEETIYLSREQLPTLTAYFHLQRQTGYFILQVYVPCILIVFCSWVAFWITKKDVPGRVNLGVTTVLSITTIGFGGRATGPEVSYATALDYFVIFCFAFVFAAVLEFAFINFMERAANKRRRKMLRLQQDLIERIARSKTTVVTSSTDTVTTSLRNIMKLPLSIVPSADNEVTIVTDDHPLPETKEALKTLLKLPLTVLPEGTEQIKAKDKSKDHECGPSTSEDPHPEKMIPSKWRGRLRDLKKKVSSKYDTREPLPQVVVNVDSEADQIKPPPHKITLWELLMQKKKLMVTLTPSYIIPAEEEVTELFSIVDIYARIIFPSLFFMFCFIYWYLFTYQITDIFPEDLVNEPQNGNTLR